MSSDTYCRGTLKPVTQCKCLRCVTDKKMTEKGKGNVKGEDID